MVGLNREIISTVKFSDLWYYLSRSEMEHQCSVFCLQPWPNCGLQF